MVSALNTSHYPCSEHSPCAKPHSKYATNMISFSSHCNPRKQGLYYLHFTKKLKHERQNELLKGTEQVNGGAGS